MSKFHKRRSKTIHSTKDKVDARQKSSRVIFNAVGDASRMLFLAFTEKSEPSCSKANMISSTVFYLKQSLTIACILPLDTSVVEETLFIGHFSVVY